jgi:hypothetical protein
MSMFVSVVLENGEIPESADEGSGIAKSLASNLDNLDSFARGLGLKPLGEFVVDYASELEEIAANLDVDDLEEAIGAIGVAGPWFDPKEGLTTVRGLIQHVQASPAKAHLLFVLQSLEGELENAVHKNSRFHLSLTE